MGLVQVVASLIVAGAISLRLLDWVVSLVRGAVDAS